MQQQQVNAMLTKIAAIGAMLDNDQGTTRVIMDSLPYVNGSQSFEFFTECNTRVWPNTNLPQNQFQPGEGMVVKEIGFAVIAEEGEVTDCGLTTIASVASVRSVINFTIGENRVIKNLAMGYLNPRFSLNNLNAINSPTIVDGSFNNVIAGRLITNIAIPPQIRFQSTLKLPFPIAGEPGTASGRIYMYVKGYGKLFNPQNNY